MTEAAASGAASLDTPQDAGPGERGVVTRWLKELELASEHEAHWREAAEDACRRYRDEDLDGQVGYSASVSGLGARGVSNRFNIFYSNVQIICPALYNATPRPDVRRRYHDRDAAAKEVAIILERALAYSIDVYDFDLRMRQAVKDMQVAGRGVTRVRYKPYLLDDEAPGEPEGEREGPKAEPAPDGKPEQRLAYEAVTCEHVPWKAFRVGPGRTWDEVPWIAFGPHLLRKEQIAEAFGKEAADEVNLDYTPAGCEGGDTSSPGDLVDAFRRAKVWEIWDKETRRVFWIAESFPERPLRVDEDPYGLEGFFPVPRPLYAMETTESLVPVEPFRFYREQARELSRLSARIEQIIDACRAKGVYDATLAEMERLTEEGDSVLIPSETAAHLLARGGIENGIWLWPVDRIASALKYLYQQREAIKQTIYEVTGIADIMRGATDARETLGSQRLKARFGAMRIDDARREVQRFARDLVRIKAELIAEKFSADTLRQMTGVELPSPEQKALAQVEARNAQAAGQPAPPSPGWVRDKPTWEEALEIMRADGPRGFRVDVETDQTVAGDDLDEKRAVIEFIQALSGFIQGIGPAVSAGQLPKEAAVKLLMAGMRRFRFGREVEDAFSEIGSAGPEPEGLPGPQGAQGPQDPQAAQAAQQQAMQEQAAQQQAMQQQAIQQQAMQQQEMRDREFQAKTRLQELKVEADLRLAREKAALDARTAVLLAREKAALEARANRERMEGELRLERERREADLELARLKLQAQAALKQGRGAESGSGCGCEGCKNGTGCDGCGGEGGGESGCGCEGCKNGTGCDSCGGEGGGERVGTDLVVVATGGADEDDSL